MQTRLRRWTAAAVTAILIPAASPFASGAPAPSGADDEVWAALEAATANCEVSDRYGSLEKCTGGENTKLDEAIKKKTPLGSLETLSHALVSGEPKMANLAANLLYMKVKDGLKDAGKDPSRISPETVDRLLQGLPKLKGMVALYATRTAVHAAMITGQEQRLYAVLDAHPEKQARTEGYGWVMQYGRMKAFPKVQELATGSDADLARIALGAPRNMYEWTADEHTTLCPWGRGFLETQDLKTAYAAGWLMVRCRGEYIDTLLADGEKRLAAGQFKDPYSQIFREPCFSFIAGADKAAEQEQCDRVYAFLEKVANDKSVPSTVRALALWNIYYQRRDQKSLDLMRKYENHEDPEIAKRAADAIKSLTTTYKLK